MSDDYRFGAAIAEIDATNAADPNTVTINGVARPKELAHSELMTQWVKRLDPSATEEQLLAARAHHIRRWTIERSDYPEGRAGYLKWRTALSKQHSAEVAHIMRDIGYDEPSVERVQQIVQKQGRQADEHVQTHEDALCLVFLETQFAELNARLGKAKTVDVVAKTVRKMSDQALQAATEIQLTDDLAIVLDEAVTTARTSP